MSHDWISDTHKAELFDLMIKYRFLLREMDDGRWLAQDVGCGCCAGLEFIAALVAVEERTR